MKNKNIEVEGGELILRSAEGHYAIIPAKHRLEVQGMIDDGCEDCLNNYIQTLPKEKDYAEDGTLIEPDPPIKPVESLSTYSVVSTDGASKPVNNKKGLYDKAVETYPILNPNNWGVEDFSSHKEFGNAYKDARTKGLKEFMWNGKRYNSQNSGTPTQQYAMYGNVNAQVDSEVSDKTSTRIIQNSITGKGVINPELLERNFTINTLAGSPEYKHTTLSKLQNKRYNNYLSNNNLPNVLYTDKDWNTFTEEHRKRSMYNMITGNIIGHDYIDEEAHGYQGTQYKENDIVTMAKYWVNNPFFTKEQQYKLYDDPNSYEYDAHTIVEPVLKAYKYGDISKEDIPIYIKNMQDHKEDMYMWSPYKPNTKQRGIMKVQQTLYNLGFFDITEDGDEYFGPKTQDALKRYQEASNNPQETLPDVQPNYNRTPNKYGKAKKNVNRNKIE